MNIIVSLLMAFFVPDCTTIANGNYNNPAIWSCGFVPDSTKNIKVNHVVNITANQSCKNYEFGSGAKLIFTGNFIFKVKGG